MAIAGRHTRSGWRPLVVLMMLAAATLACAEKQLADLRVYSATPGPASQFYDAASDTILADDVWVFRPDGTVSAMLNVGGEPVTVEGRYHVDDDDTFVFVVNTDDDGAADYILYADAKATAVDWHTDGRTLTYWLAP